MKLTMTVKNLVLSLFVAVVVGLVAEYFIRKMGVANVGGTVGGIAGIVTAMLLNRKQSKKD